MRIEGRSALDYPAYRQLVWVVNKRQVLKVLAFVLLMAVGGLLLSPVAGVVLLVGFLVAVPIFFDLLLRRAWRRLSVDGPAVKVGYELTSEGMRVCLGGVSTQHRWDSLRPLQQTARHWLFQGVLSRRTIAVPRDAFSAEAGSEVDAVFVGLPGQKVQGARSNPAPGPPRSAAIRQPSPPADADAARQRWTG
ncbi:YcxB family protein [Micromonospora sp. NPDC093277]|uniref:YcxB family protein n=1 Tax=Micromonospora sp. NPDC093277 TaxID=3364291 RepID=UPI00382F3490